MDTLDFDTYHSYPLCLPIQGSNTHDIARYRVVLDENEDQLFITSSSDSKLEFRECIIEGALNDANSTPSRGRLSAPCAVNTEESLFGLLKKPILARSTRLIAVYRTNSWSRMRITLRMLRAICGLYKLNPFLISLLASMGYKLEPNDEHFTTFHNNISTRVNNEQATTEVDFDVCYNLRHFERHERDLKNPWSCRQVVVHQKFYMGDSRSVLLIVQPPKGWNANLDDAKFNSDTHPLALHIRLLWLATNNHREYLNYMSKEVLALDQRVCFSKPLAGFDFDFKLNQKAQSLRKSLYHSKMMLDGMSQIVDGLSSHAEATKTSAQVSSHLHNAFVRELASMMRDLNNHKSTTAELLGVSKDVKSTIYCIVELRNQELLRLNIAQLQRLAEAGSKETRYMAQIAERTHRDSQTMRVATVIAMIYLPANVVLAFFSTIFVEFSATSSDASNKASGGLQLHPQVWISVLITLALILCTWGFFWFFSPQRRAVRILGLTH